MSVHLRLTIEADEYSALLKLALSEMRNPENQLRFLLRKELCNQGLIKIDEILKPSESITIANNPDTKETHDEQ